ncbi:hypothetical protein Bhyg_06731, partial [Pseudolycoriella hygida]
RFKAPPRRIHISVDSSDFERFTNVYYADGSDATTKEEALEVLLEKYFSGIDSSPSKQIANKEHRRKPKAKDRAIVRRLVTEER